MDDISQGLALLYEWGPVGVLLVIFLTKWSPNSVVAHEREATKMANQRADAEREINVENTAAVLELSKSVEHLTELGEMTVSLLKALPGSESLEEVGRDPHG